jgi:hypothetical protein
MLHLKTLSTKPFSFITTIKIIFTEILLFCIINHPQSIVTIALSLPQHQSFLAQHHFPLAWVAISTSRMYMFLGHLSVRHSSTQLSCLDAGV